MMAAEKEELINIFGPENVLDDTSVIETYSRDESFVHPLKPRFLVKAQNAGQVEKLVQWANQTGTPLVPVSSGPPHFRGDTVPGAPGAVMVDLSGMKKIIRVDRRNRMALIEPGVTFCELQPELEKYGLRLSQPLLPRANKSVVAALLEREPMIIPRYQWAALDPLRCMEIVWGDGQRMTTGEAGSLGSLQDEWDLKLAQANPQGPIQTDFYKIASGAQGSMGIVTWASVKCEVLPRVRRLYMVPCGRLGNLVELLYSILRIRFGDELFVVNNWELASILGGGGGRIQELAVELPGWVLVVGIAGRDRLGEERVGYQEADLKEMAQRQGLEMLPAVKGASGREVLEAITGCSGEPYWKVGYKGGVQEVFFLSTLERSGEFIEVMYRVAEGAGYPTSEVGVYIQPVHQGASCHIEFDLAYDKGNVGEVRRMQELYVKASEELVKAGAYYSRPYGIWSGLAFNRDAQSTQVLKKIKGIFDPRGVMNPGKLCF
jgi:FAD/FMN-containing dehydrogenase